jgi:hypothetical protein
MQFDNRDEVKLWIIRNQEGRRNLTDGWKYNLAQTKKAVLQEMGKAKQKETLGGFKHKDLSVLSIVDKTEYKPTHNTRLVIAEDLGWSTGKVAMADRVWKEAEPAVIDKVLTNEITINEAYQEVKAARKVENRVKTIAKINAIAQANVELEVSKTYPVIYCDPPWRYEHSISDSRQIENQYPTMDLPEICALPVNDLSTQDG